MRSYSAGGSVKLLVLAVDDVVDASAKTQTFRSVVHIALDLAKVPLFSGNTNVALAFHVLINGFWAAMNVYAQGINTNIVVFEARLTITSTGDGYHVVVVSET